MLLSVIMPARNAAATIQRAVDTTLRALPPQSELLVLNDGSSDETAALLKRVRDSRLILLSSPSASGVSASLNTLLAHARGTYIARMDADDVTLPGRFNSQLRRLRRGVDITFGGVLHFGQGLRYPYPSPPLAISPAAFPIALLIANPVAHSTMAARRSTIVDLRGYRQCAAEDYDLWLRSAESGLRLFRSRRPITGLRRHTGQVTARPDWNEKALEAPEWRESYARLAVAALPTVTQEAARSLLVAPRAGQMQATVSEHLDAAIRRLSRQDQAALTLLRRRTARAGG